MPPSVLIVILRLSLVSEKHDFSEMLHMLAVPAADSSFTSWLSGNGAMLLGVLFAFAGGFFFSVVLRKINSGTFTPLVEGRSVFSGLINNLFKKEPSARQLEKELEQSEARYRTLVEDASDMIFEMNDSGQFVYANPAVEKISGFEVTDLIGRHYWEFILPEFRAEIKEFYMSQVQQAESDSYYECPILNMQGEERWIGQRARMYFSEGGRRITRVIARDITQQRQTQRDLELSERRFRTLAVEAPVGIFQADMEGKYVYVNEMWQEITGLDFNKGLGHGWVSAIRKDKKEFALDIWKRFIEAQKDTDEPFRFPVINQRTNETRWVTSRVVVLRDRLGKPYGFLGTVQDITQMKEQQDLLATNEAKLNLLFENTNDMIWSVDADRNLTSCNPKFKKLIESIYHIKISEGDRMPDDAFPEKVRERWKEWDALAFKGVSFKKEAEFYVDDQLVVVEHDFYPVVDDGEVKTVTIFSRDITHYKQAERQEKKYKEGLKLLNELGSDSLDPDEKIKRAVSRVSEFLGMPLGIVSHFLRGEKLEILYTVKDYPPVVSGAVFDLHDTYCSIVYRQQQAVIISEMNASGYSDLACYRSLQLESFIGAPIWVNGVLYGAISYASPDIRKHAFNRYDQEFILLFARWIGSVLQNKAYANQLIEAKDKAETASEAKMNFLSAMSHEIRTPLNAIIGMSRLLVEDSPRPDQKENLELLRFSGENLLSIINDILDLNKMEAGKIELEHTTFNLHKLINNSVKSFNFRAREKKLDLKFFIDERLSQHFIGDSHRLTQVINNLLSNALKFTESGEVQLSVNQLMNGPERTQILFKVIDTGIGIAADKLDLVFEDFMQASSDTSRKYGGTGLGLPIVKKLLHLMGSEVMVKSEPGEGTCFSFELSLPKSCPEEAFEDVLPEDKIVDLSVFDMNVLLVEDNAANQLIARKFLERWGVNLSIADNGKQGLEMVQSKVFDIVLMDLQMPEMDGYETCKQIRQLPDEYFKQLPVIALSASILREISGRALAAGMNDFISKPFDPLELNHRLLHYLSESPRHNMANTADFVLMNNPTNRKVSHKGDLDKILDEISRNDMKFKQELSELYRLNILDLRDNFVRSVEEGDKETVRRVAHKIQPTLVMLQLEDIREEMDRIRRKIKGHTFGGMHKDLTHFIELCDQAALKLENISNWTSSDKSI